MRVKVRQRKQLQLHEQLLPQQPNRILRDFCARPPLQKLHERIEAIDERHHRQYLQQAMHIDLHAVN